MKIVTRTLAVACAAAATAVLWSTAWPGQPMEAGAPVAAGSPAYAVEDFNYPQADKILAEQDIVLKRGDGHITLVDCASGTGFLEVWARDKVKICFKVVGNSGFLTMEIPAVYGVKGNNYTTQVDMTVGTEEKSFDISKNSWTPVGESADEQGRDHMLVEIRTSK